MSSNSVIGLINHGNKIFNFFKYLKKKSYVGSEHMLIVFMSLNPVRRYAFIFSTTEVKTHWISSFGRFLFLSFFQCFITTIFMYTVQLREFYSEQPY